MNELTTIIFFVSAGLIILQLFAVVASVALLHCRARREQLYAFNGEQETGNRAQCRFQTGILTPPETIRLIVAGDSISRG